MVDNHLSIFSIPLFSENISLDNENIKEFCFLRRNNDRGRSVSNVGGWQSNDFNINKPPKELKELSKYIFNFSLKVCDFLNIEPVRFGHAWININEHRNFNWSHTHPESTLSGVYYVKTPHGCGNIEFENPCRDMMTTFKPKMYNQFNSSSFMIKSEAGKLYVFPGWLPHKVYPNMSNEERISISFNLK